MGNKFLQLGLIFVLIVFIAILDLGANLFSFIPIIGDLLETMSETVFETLQVLLAGFGFWIAGRK